VAQSGPDRGDGKLSTPFDHGFELDRFQVEAREAILAGRNVLVAAPTGAGKTVVAEFAVAEALRSGRTCCYTAPIKALSNQKFGDLRRVLGRERVGLLTGDHSINPDAPVVVMTTEVLRNMVYAGAPALDRLGWVVLDEVHFLQDTYRGPVWEEVLIHTPPGVGFVCLSATVSNAEELGDWIATLRGPTDLVVEHQRPIRLDPLMLVGDRQAERDHLVPLLVRGRTNPEGHRFDADRPVGRPARGRPRHRFRTPRRLEVVDRLQSEDLLPMIYFIFSRNGCDEAAAACRDGGVRLADAEQRRRIHAIVDERTASLDHADLEVLGFERWLSTLESGVAAHHAGMIPAFREAVEDCFNEGLLGVVFATETLALGINMPARSVVIERLSKYNGERHEFLTPGQFTQLTGRAGRRGIDASGSAVVLWSPFATFEQVAGLAASREFPLASAFRPTYNMAANLVDRYEPDAARQVLGRSFAQFQTDRALVRLEARRTRLVAEIAARAAPPEGRDAVFDLEGYHILHEELRAARARKRGDRSATERALGALRPGDVIERTTPKGTRRLVVLAVGQRKGGAARVRATDARGRPVRLDASNVSGPPIALTRVDLPVPYQPQDPGYRKKAAQLLARINPRRLARPGGADDGADEIDPVAAARALLEAHPLHDHPERDQLLVARRDTARLESDLVSVEREQQRRGGGLGAQFEAICAVLRRTGHIEDWSLTRSGRRLRRIYHESDLLISLAVDRSLFDDLDRAEVAALASCLTYEHRSSEPPPVPVVPSAILRTRVRQLEELHGELTSLEQSRGLPLTRAPDPGFAAAAWSWAAGHELDVILDEELTGGDFVRNVRQLVDLLRQLGQVIPTSSAAASARGAADSLVRGVIVAAGSPE